MCVHELKDQLACERAKREHLEQALTALLATRYYPSGGMAEWEKTTEGQNVQHVNRAISLLRAALGTGTVVATPAPPPEGPASTSNADQVICCEAAKLWLQELPNDQNTDPGYRHVRLQVQARGLNGSTRARFCPWRGGEFRVEAEGPASTVEEGERLLAALRALSTIERMKVLSGLDLWDCSIEECMGAPVHLFCEKHAAAFRYQPTPTVERQAQGEGAKENPLLTRDVLKQAWENLLSAAVRVGTAGHVGSGQHAPTRVTESDLGALWCARVSLELAKMRHAKAEGAKAAEGLAPWEQDTARRYHEERDHYREQLGLAMGKLATIEAERAALMEEVEKWLAHLEHCSLDRSGFGPCERRTFGMVLSRFKLLWSLRLDALRAQPSPTSEATREAAASVRLDTETHCVDEDASASKASSRHG